MSLAAWKRNIKALDLIVLAGLVYMLGLFYIHTTNKIEDFFVVNKVDVSDHVEGGYAGVIYDRDVRRPFWAGWRAVVKSVSDDDIACRAHGHHEYLPTDGAIRNTAEGVLANDYEVTLNWYMEKECNLGPGRYFITTIWELDNGLTASNTSNVFTVYSARDWFLLQADALHPHPRPPLVPLIPQRLKGE